MYGIYKTTYYYANTYTNDKSGPLYRDDEHKHNKARVTFKTKEDAEAWLLAEREYREDCVETCEEYTGKHGKKYYREKGAYVLRNGEYERPDYKIVKLKSK